ncbi:helix-turn-helix transcriptional regulator [Oscillospiraceae bacterium OttesenSCG-928-G22]|nr:helix-turn-helix transcriptional regulator [Oscillospiraceae bacterium OttesenSCG-928-G22]
MDSIKSELENLSLIMSLIANQFGSKCEVVLHDWGMGYDRSIIAIENGHVTNRTVGNCGSNLGLEVMRGTSDGKNQFNYVTKTKDGKTLRSSTVYFKNDAGESIGALCINLDITDLISAQETVAAYTMFENDIEEQFVNNVSELLEYFLAESVRVVGKRVEDMKKEDKMKALRYLDGKGALLIAKSGTRICKFFNISKFTLYNYLDELRSSVDE